MKNNVQNLLIHYELLFLLIHNFYFVNFIFILIKIIKYLIN